MCGFAGIFSFGDQPLVDQEQNIKKMSDLLYHRGPDDYGFALEENFALGFRRLKIIDLNAPCPPFITEDRRFYSVCNGEIYNHKRLKEELEKSGDILKTSTDTEVIPFIYRKYSSGILNKLDGQFAFAVIDKKSRELFLARDHFGVCPLFYTITPKKKVIFASEIKSILQHPEVLKDVDFRGFDQTLSFPGLFEGQTMFKGIFSLPAGHFLKAGSNGNITISKYWDLNFPTSELEHNSQTEVDIVENIEELLLTSVKKRLQSDAGVGLYLSGGLDSTLLGAMINKVSGSDVGFHSFAIDFDDHIISEGKFQRFAAKFLKTKHESKKFTNQDIMDYIEKVIYHSECPLKESFNTAALFLSGLVKDQQCKVVIAGQGADELFGGYIGYRFDSMRLSEKSESYSQEDQSIQERLWTDATFFYEKKHSELLKLKRNMYGERVLEDFERINCLNDFPIDQNYLRGRSHFHKRSYLDFKLRLGEHLLNDHGDRMVMANSVEGRYPFLDLALVEYVAKIPYKIKIKNFDEKYILKELAKKYIPAPIIQREKFGFTAPGSPYLLNLNDDYINDLLSIEKIKKEGYFNPNYISKLLKKYRKPGFRVNVPFEQDYIFMVLSFQLFNDIFIRKAQ